MRKPCPQFHESDVGHKIRLLMRLFQRFRLTPPAHRTRGGAGGRDVRGATSGDVEAGIREIGTDLFELARSRSGGLLPGKFWSDKLMAWSMNDPSFKTQLFRFVDVMPALRTPEQVHAHLVEYLTQPGVTPRS